MQIQAAAAQNRPQPPVPLATLQKPTVSRKRNKKKKATPKTVEPLAVKQKAGSGENGRKLPANLDRLSVEAAEASLKTEPPVAGFGIVLESSSSDEKSRRPTPPPLPDRTVALAVVSQLCRPFFRS
uniref:Uncharacterized protein n=1 Tax=Micrurus paraensis TaxID=1970185 RepID=A0A2D4K048_9SAUR